MKSFSWFWGAQFSIAIFLVSYGLFSVPSGETSLNIPDKILHFLAFSAFFISLTYMPLATANALFLSLIHISEPTRPY